MAKQPDPRTRPDPTPEEDHSEAAAWTQAFESHEPDPHAGPFTPEENAQIRDLLVHARLTGDEALFAQLEGLAKDPAAYRRMIASLPGDAPAE